MAVTRQSAKEFLAWLYVYEPKVFAAVLKKAQAAKKAGQLGMLGQSVIPTVPISLSAVPSVSVSMPTDTGLSGGGFWSDLASGLSSVGSDLSSAVSDATSYLTSGGGFAHLASLATTYLNDQTAKTIQTQALRAQAGMAPANVGYTTNSAGQVVPVATNPYTGQVALNPYGQPQAITPAMLQQMQPSAISQYLPYILGGGALLVLVLLLK